MKFEILRSAAIAVAALAGGALAETAIPAAYSLGNPEPAVVYDDPSGGNAWAAANAVFVATAGYVAAPATSEGNTTAVGGGPAYRLEFSEAGYTWERLKPEYYLSDRITPPPGEIDWVATCARYQERLAQGDVTAQGFLFNTDDADPCIYVADGGVHSIDWVFKDATTNSLTYVCATAGSGRPRRIYWTDYPYNGTPISLQGKFVRFFGSEAILGLQKETVTNIVGGVEMVQPNTVVSGLYLDPMSMTLYAKGKITGQVLMAYYDDGNYDSVLAVQAVEVCQPDVIVNKGVVGTALKPDGRGYDVEGLTADVKAGIGDVLDGRGDYLYQHKGAHSYSPKNNEVFPLRPTKGERWKAEIWWMEEDAMKVKWPFEIDQYNIDWPADIQRYVRGDVEGDYGADIVIPEAYSATLQTYQEPDGHARAVENGVFHTVGEGKALLKLDGEDNVWFMPIESINRSNTKYFTLKAENIRVGEELTLREGAKAGVAPDVTFHATMDEPGYIYPATSCKDYNPNLYNATNALPAIYAVAAHADQTLEVWWREQFQRDDMPEPIAVPVLPQVYQPVWPGAYDAPQIVLASQQGSAGESLFTLNGAAHFDSSSAKLTLESGDYFPGDTMGTVMFWLRNTGVPSESWADTSGIVLQIGNPYVYPVFLQVNNGKLQIRSTEPAGSPTRSWYAPLPEKPASEWVHVAITWNADGSTLYYDGAKCSETNGVLVKAKGNWMDCSVNGGTGARELGELMMYSRCLTASEVAAEMTKSHTGEEAGLTGYYSFREGEDLVAGEQSAQTTTTAFRNRVTGTACTATGVSFTKDAKLVTSVMPLVCDAETTPTVYYQNNPVDEKGFPTIGYNPNDEHAFVKAGNGGYVAWALRCDLATANTMPPAVLVEYVQNGKSRMQFYHVVATNALWQTLSADCTAGTVLPGPHPLDYFENPWLKETNWECETGKPGPAYRDRKGQIWGRAAGTLGIHMYYAMQEGFYFPSLGVDEQPAVGTPIPWLAGFAGNHLLTGDPALWTWNVGWPANVPEMKIGQTLSVAASGLPEMWNAKSMSVVYPNPGEEAEKVVMLSDPTVKQTVAFDYNDLEKCGLSINANGGLTYRKGKYYFTELPPSLSSRLYLDASNNTLCFIGERVEKNAGVTILYPNVLSEAERRAAISLVKPEAEGYAAWETAINALALAPVVPNTMGTEKNSGSEITTVYKPVDHYALTAMGGTNYVTVIENDATDEQMFQDDEAGISNKTSVKVGDPINMHIFKVVPEYYVGRVVTREDEVNLLSQQLSIIYTEPFGGKADDYEFEWKSADPNPDGTIPMDFDNGYLLRPLNANFEDTASGLTRIVVGQQGDTLANMVNKYWVCRYRAKDATVPAYATMGDNWSAWTTPPALAEGWVQRVLNNVTPFNQRMTDLYENKAETAVSMIQQAGAPYEGDVALNQDNLTSVGLIQLYETILNKAESMSLMLGINDAGANKQLLLAVERLGDLYKVLGDEAYSDAKNPTIGFGTKTTELMDGVNVGGESSSLFCFDNQVPTLLDEELALLRGRTGASAPTTQLGPYYNRLLWNFTKGITAGEVAYAVNYNVSGTETVALSEEQAARTYPQGHGDAYGHYLSALKGWYRLLRNPYFSWGAPAQGEMNVADAAINVDYYEESKFAEAAADLAKTAADVMDLTARKAWRDEGGGGYFDSDTDNAFGTGEWASRGAYGALVNWVAANSLLPASSATNTNALADFDDPGLMRIDRGTVDELADICAAVDRIVRVQDRLNAGLNPLGLSDHAIPFDISPKGASDGTNTHFEQIRDRAKTALANAKIVLDRAQTQSNRLRLIEETANQYADQIADEEEDLDEQLLQIFGSPYSDDIGPGKTYPQGYEGPDLIHYAWMDLDKYGLDTPTNNTIKTYTYQDYHKQTTDFWAMTGIKKENGEVALEVTASGIVKKPDDITGTRVRPGTIQMKYAEFLQAYAWLEKYKGDWDDALSDFESQTSYLEMVYGFHIAETALQEAYLAFQFTSALVSKTLQDAIDDAQDVMIVTLLSNWLSEGVTPSVVGAGTTVVTDIGSPIAAATAPTAATAIGVWAAQKTGNSAFIDGLEMAETEMGNILDMEGLAHESAETVHDLVDSYRELMDGVCDAADALNFQIQKLNALVDEYCAEVAKGQALLEKRMALRKRQVNNLSKLRYNEMLFRRIRDKTLSRYSTLFDIAQQYVFQAAQVYDYETAMKPEAEGSGDAFKAKIVATRALGAFDANGNPMVADDGDLGLAGYLAQMDQNWLVLKPRLGINNPQPYATWFSLRGELFRILPGEEGNAAWAKELTKYWVDDIQSNAEFKRHCQPFQSQFGLKDREPGLIIPFSTTIDFAKNLFGNELAGGDHAYDSTWYATRIAAAGVWFDGYNAKAAGGLANLQPQLANTPVVYLVPVGFDRMRAPGLADGTFWNFSVVDQVIPAPWAIGREQLDSDTWMPSLTSGDYDGVDSEVKIRKHPSFRAYYDAMGGAPTDDKLDATRLIGRSVWNTRWLLVIPAGAMNADRDKALATFINGVDANRDGILDQTPVRDIKIGFKTYSQSGN
ncbi:MAG: LamG domain-containing protein [Kiritimatiellae bacterium]|nr:LamG domain-containing protein [Kiritimatiellia bacterium]